MVIKSVHSHNNSHSDKSQLRVLGSNMAFASLPHLPTNTEQLAEAV
jgi:hypothetical protein